MQFDHTIYQRLVVTAATMRSYFVTESCRSCLSPPKIGALGSMYILHNYRLNMHNELVLTLTILQLEELVCYSCAHD
jgi:hypothetical protein